MKKILLSMVAVATSLAAGAVEVDGLEYTLDNTALTATVTADIMGEGYSGDIVIPDDITAAGRTYSVVAIAQSAFEGNIITSVKIGDNVTSIGKWAFYGCSNLAAVDFGTGMANGIEIPANAFQQSTSITSVTCRASVPAYLYSAGFSTDVYANATLYVPADAVSAYKDSASGNNWYRFSNIQPISEEGAKVDVINIDGLVFNLDHENLTASVAAAYAANRNFDISGYSGDVEIPAEINANDTTYTVTSLFEECFYTTSPVTIKFPDTLRTVGWESFYAIGSLTRLDFPDSVEEIGDGCFYNLSNVTEIVLGSGMQTLGGKSTWVSYCFCTLPNMTNLTCLADTPPAATETTFQPAVKQNATLTVPYGKAEVYENAPYWDGFKEYVELPDYNTGVGTIERDGGTSVTYFNLQGVEVVPTDGQIVIEVCGGKSVKKIFSR